MERDLCLIRELLFLIESKPTYTGPINLEIDGYSDSAIIYNLDLAIKAGLVDGSVKWAADTDQYAMISVFSLTWEGHEFLDSLRQDDVWRETQETVQKAGHNIAAFSLELLKAVATEIIKGRLGLPT